MVGIRSGHVYNTTNLLLLSLTTLSTTTEALAVSVKRWAPLLFSLSNQQQRVMKRPKMDIVSVLLTPILEPSYRANAAVTAKEKAFSGGGANVRWNSTMRLNDPKNNSNPVVCVVNFFREHLLDFSVAVAFGGSCGSPSRHFAVPSCGIRSNTRKWNQSAFDRLLLLLEFPIICMWAITRALGQLKSTQLPIILKFPMYSVALSC